MKATSAERNNRSDDPILSNELLDLAEQIRDHIAAAEEAAETAAQRVIEGGQLLNEAKRICPYGQWTRFLKAAGISVRRAQQLMQIVNAGLKCETVSHLGFRGALEYLADLKKEEEEPILADERQDHIQTAIAANQLAEQQRGLLATGQTLNFEGMVLRQVPGHTMRPGEGVFRYEPSPDRSGSIRLVPDPISPPDAPDARKVKAHAEAIAEVLEIDPSEIWHDLSEIEMQKLSNELLALQKWIDDAKKAKP